MAATFTFDKVNKIIEVDLPDTSVSVQEIYNACKDYEARVYNLEVAKIADGAGKQELGGTVKVGITITLLDWKIKFADRPPSTYVLCEISGGNLVGYDTSLLTYYVPIEPAAYVTIVRTSSSSATLMELDAIQYSSYQNSVWIDTINGQSGTEYPIGTSEYPVDNLTDAKIIATNRGFDTIRIIGNFSFGAIDNIDNFQICGQNPILTTLTFTSGCSTNGTEISEAKITGTLSGEVELRDCVIQTLAGFYGTATRCYLTDNITLGGTNSDIATFIECYLGTTVLGLVEIDMNGDGPALAMRAYTGGVKVTNKSGSAKVAIDFVSGRLEITNTVTAGTFFVRGVGEITSNEGTGITVNDNSLTQRIKIETDKIQGVKDDVATVDANVLSILSDTGFIKDVEGGKWSIVGDEMIFYKSDNVTEVMRFTIARDVEGNPIMRTRQ